MDVGGAFLSASLSALFDRLSNPQILGLSKARNQEGALTKLKILLNCVNGMLDDAEEKQITNRAVREWLDDLKDAVYQADDYLDEITYEALRSKSEAGNAPKPKLDQVSQFFSSISPFKTEIVRKLENILVRLESLVTQQSALGLVLRDGFGKNPLSKHIETSPHDLEQECKIYGRDDEKETVIKLLLDDGNSNGCSVIPIVGIGGIGKTTLTNYVYNDVRVQRWFGLRIWVCVSEKSDLFDVFKVVLEEIINGKASDDIQNLDRVQHEIKEKLMGKKFLLVLDDLWNQKYCKWDALLKPLKYGGKGSKIIITTRNKSIEKSMDLVPAIHLKGFSEDDCWFLFVKLAFQNGNFRTYPQLEAIAREIVRKCGGLPLAVKILGGLLRSKSKTVKEWLLILHSRQWDLLEDDILPALRLSYHHLPSQLKQCFAYCAIFSKQYRFTRKNLVPMWMAEGFLSPSRVSMEELGNKYFNELVSRSFLQPSGDDRSSFVMHDLIYDLAKSVSGEFCLRAGGEDSDKISVRTRHLSCKGIGTDEPIDLRRMVEAISRARNLCTFRAADGWAMLKSWEDWIILDDFLPKLKHVRILTLPFFNMHFLPNSVGNLKHLRYLDLSYSSIQSLPETITTLYNLETLYSHACIFLLKLPANFSRLTNLCHLDIIGTKVEEMPPRIGELRKIKTLTGFVLGKDGGHNIKELGKMEQIRELVICFCHAIINIQDASEANMKDKRYLEKLELKWYDESDSPDHETSLLNELEPHTHLKNLSISGYNGTKFPNWLGHSSFSCMEYLELHGIKHCTSLPSLGQLPALKKLLITDFNEVIVIGSDFYGSCKSTKKPFPALEILRFERLPMWEKWVLLTEAFPQLQELYIGNCPKLSSIPEEGLPLTIFHLDIFKCPLLKKRCLRGSGEDWTMISYIRDVHICRSKTVKRLVSSNVMTKFCMKFIAFIVKFVECTHHCIAS